jgi:hypothetical protein
MEKPVVMEEGFGFFRRSIGGRRDLIAPDSEQISNGVSQAHIIDVSKVDDYMLMTQ